MVQQAAGIFNKILPYQNQQYLLLNSFCWFINFQSSEKYEGLKKYLKITKNEMYRFSNVILLDQSAI